MADSIFEALDLYLKSKNSDGYLFSGPIDAQTADEVIRLIDTHADRRQDVCFFLTTFGGDPDCAYRIGKALRRTYGSGKVTFLIGGYCKSAGTLLALCADELVFSAFGELGPLDVQIGKVNELMGADSGLDLNQSLEQLATTAFNSFEEQMVAIVQKSAGSISTRVAASIATDLTTGIFSPITAQIDPLRLGVLWRSNQIGLRYAQRLASDNVKPSAVHSLVYEYPAHGFVIDEEEARQLFSSVRHCDEAEDRIFASLQPIFRVPRAKGTAVILGLPADSSPTDASDAVPSESISTGEGEKNEEDSADCRPTTAGLEPNHAGAGAASDPGGN